MNLRVAAAMPVLRRIGGVSALSVALLINMAGMRLAQAQTFTTLHAFNGPPNDGSQSYAGLVRDASGNLYGATELGGSGNHGTVFKLDTSGKVTVLHSFQGGSNDGAQPYTASLILDSSGNLYGTTQGGGSANRGTVFKLDTAGNNFTLLYSFQYGNDGADPTAGLILDSSGNLYGTTVFGGVANYGTVFKLDIGGNNYTVLHSFEGGSSDGVYPEASLVLDSSGNLYGTTLLGGSLQDCGPYSGTGCGTVFKVDTSGNNFTLLHSFVGGNSDGAEPIAALTLDSSGNLYGTTAGGGPANDGTVFKLDRSGNNFTVLHSFSGSDGASPYAGVVLDSSGNLYGTTVAGGLANGGTVFKLDTSGNVAVLHIFSVSDGLLPYAGLIRDPSGNLYGTASAGGPLSNCWNCGTVFEIIQLLPFSTFNAQLAIDTGRHPGFALNATFTLGTASAGLQPATDAMTLQIANYTLTLPAGSFHQQWNASNAPYVYQGTVNGANLLLTLLPLGNNNFQFDAVGSPLTFTGVNNPVTVSLTFGSNSGKTTVNAAFTTR